MEMSYHELNRREYELTKHVSLQQVDPIALMKLRATGRYTVDLPETLFDMDCPGHYFRRIKTVAVSIPCVTGPYTSVNCTLTLLKSAIHKTAQLHGGEGENPYARSVEDNRFSDYFGSLESIVTSSGQNDSGLFETALHDERVLPFEGSGVISTWQLQLPANPAADDRCQFDYDTISDIILHFRYTAREGGEALRDSALTNAKDLINQARAVASVRVLSVRHDFPNEWAGLKATPSDQQLPYNLVLPLREEHFPLWFQKDSDQISKLEVFSKPSPEAATLSVNDNELARAWGDIYRGEVDNDTPSLPASLQDINNAGGLPLQLSDNGMEELWIAVTWNDGSA